MQKKYKTLKGYNRLKRLIESIICYVKYKHLKKDGIKKLEALPSFEDVLVVCPGPNIKKILSIDFSNCINSKIYF